jgi:serine/threonine protein kinase
VRRSIGPARFFEEIHVPQSADEQTQALRAEQQWVVGGRYRVLDRLGHGGMADVFRAHDELLDRDVAVKVFRTESAAGPLDTNAELRRELELQSLAQLSHPNLITLFDGSVSGDGPGYLVLELVAGRDLSSRIKDGPLPERLVRQIGAQLADALAYVHAHGMVHRDVKPANVLLGEDGLPGVVRARLSDFGIVRFIGRERMTSADLTLGTASYIAPEQARGADAEPPADVYSLGLVLIEALTGQRCFDGPLLEAMAARLAASPAVPADLPAPWPALLSAMTAMDPEQRPGAAQVVEVLRDSAEIEPPPPAPGPAVPLPLPGPDVPVPPVLEDGYYWDEPAERSRRGLAITLALFAVAAIAAGASYLAWGNGVAPASDPTVVPSAPASHSTSHAARHRSAPRVVSSAPTTASHSATHTAAPISKSHSAATHTRAASSKAPPPSSSPAPSTSAAQTSSTPSASPSTSSTAAPAATDAPKP